MNMSSRASEPHTPSPWARTAFAVRYQLVLAQANDQRTARGEPRRQAMTFAEFSRIDAEEVRRLFTQSEWKRERERAGMESLGWVIAYLPVRADTSGTRYAGRPSSWRLASQGCELTRSGATTWSAKRTSNGRVEHITSEVARMRDDADCLSSNVATL
jgi:hypothetical protein